MDHRLVRTLVTMVVGACAVAIPVGAQVMTRLATTLEAIAAYPAFYHDKAVTLVGAPAPLPSGVTGLPMPDPAQFVLQPRSGDVPQRAVELRGRLFDIGRFLSDDSRLGPLGLRSIIDTLSPDRWPARERLFVMTGATWAEPPSSTDVSLRAIALTPAVYDGRTVTVRGRFRGRNLLGDLPAWPRESQWDFVLQAADAAIWVLGRRPRGDGFDLNTSSRAHTGRWLEATGRIEIRESLPVLVADRLATATADDDEVEVPEPPPAPLPAPEIVFSAPTQNEVAVPPDVTVRVQFSRPMNAGSFDGQVRVRYPSTDALQPPPFATVYRAAPMAVELRFEYPLAAGTVVEVTLGSGITAADGGPFAGATLRFTTSGF